MTVLIGENDAGKSTLLDALDLALNRKNPIIDDFYVRDGEQRETRIQIELVFIYDPDEEKPESQYIDESGKLYYRATYQVGSSLYEVKAKKFSNELLNRDFTKLKAGEFDEVLLALEIEIQGRRNNEVRLQKIEEYVNTNNPEQVEGWLEIRNLFDKYIPRFEKYSSAEYKSPELMIQKTLQTVVDSYIYEIDESGTKQLIAPLKVVKEELKNNLDIKVEELLSFVQSYNSKVTGLEIEPIVDFSRGFQTGKLFLNDSSGTYHVANKGEGTKKRLFLSILEWDRKVLLETDTRPVIRGYDEPDANLHYEAQRKMYYCVRDITGKENSKIQALICTHSLTMIDRAPAKSINLLKTDESGMCNVTYLRTNDDDSIDLFLNNMSQSLGVSNSSIFYERCFIFVEGPTEENALPILYANLHGSSVVEDGIKVINIEGCGGWEHTVKLMGINKREHMIFLLDSDCNEENSTCTLGQETLIRLGFESTFLTSNVIFIGTKEFEDAFDSNVYVQTLNFNWPKNDGTQWTIEEIDSLKSTDKFSKSLLEAVWQKSRLKGERKCTKPKLGIEIANYCRGAEVIPSEIKNLFTIARKVSGV